MQEPPSKERVPRVVLSMPGGVALIAVLEAACAALDWRLSRAWPEIVGSYGGRIEIDSQIGGGTTVTVRLPAVSA